MEVWFSVATLVVVALGFSLSYWWKRGGMMWYHFGPKPVSKVSWGEKMTPLKDFIENHTNNVWKQRGNPSFSDMIVNKTACTRFKITVEQQGFFENGLMLYRDEYLAEKGIYTADKDAEEFAQNLWETLFQHTSHREREYVIDLLIAEHNDLIRSRRQQGVNCEGNFLYTTKPVACDMIANEEVVPINGWDQPSSWRFAAGNEREFRGPNG